MKKIGIVFLAGLLIGMLVLNGCDKGSTNASYSTTAERMGITIPAVGITLDELCMSKTGLTYAQRFEEDMLLLYKDEAHQKPFSGSDKIYANTPIYSEVNLMDDSKQPIGEISGTITLTDVPGTAPRMYIKVKNTDDGNRWHSNGSSQWWNDSSQINLSSDNYTNLSWSIPIYEDDHFAPSNGNFTLYVYKDKDINNSFGVEIPITPYIGSVNTGGG